MDPLKKRETSQPELELVRETAGDKPAGLIPDRESGLSYTPRPELSGRKEEPLAGSGLPWVLMVVGAALAAGLVTYYATQMAAAPQAPSLPPVARAIEDTKIVANAPDLDQDATRAAREALARGEVPADLKGAPENTLRDLREGRSALYKVFIYAPGAPAGALVRATVGDAPLGDVTLASGGTIRVPLIQGVPQTLNLSVESPGAAEVHAKTSAGGEVHKTMNGGDSVQWDVVLQ